MSLRKQVVRNSKGEVVLLNRFEKARAEVIQRQFDMEIKNSLGIEISIDTLTTIIKEVSEQKFYDIEFALYLPVKVGNGAWGSDLLTYRSFALGEDFETGNVNDGSDNSRLAVADAGVDSVSVKIKNWVKGNTWNVMQLAQAAKAGNWDLISAKEESRKTNWDLGLQKIAFLGSASDPTVLGLLTQSGITTNTTLISGPISGMASVDFNNLCAQLLTVYRSNAKQTAWPDRFVIPESDYLGLASATSPDFPMYTKLEYLEKMFKMITKKSDFQILPLAYANASQQTDGLLHYTLFNADPKSIRMDIPVDYTATLANSINGFTFSNAGYGQYTGVQAYRPREMLYFTASAPDNSGNW